MVVSVFNSNIRFSFISNPIVGLYLPNSTAKGNPTYPKPIIAILVAQVETYIKPNHLILNGETSWTRPTTLI